ncbi:MAG: translocation/assembly module TamB domain-containing protein [Candidatus Competibacteraceae bacterium]
MKRRAFRWLLTLLFLVGVLLGGGGWLIATESGSRWLLLRAQGWVPGELRFQAVQGRLLDALCLNGFSYRYEDFSFRAESLCLDWRLGFDGVARVEALRGAHVAMHVPPFTDEAIILPNIYLPVRRLELADVQFQPMRVQYADTTPFTLATVTLRGVATDRLTLEFLRLRASWLTLDIDGTQGLRTPHPLDLNLAGSAAIDDRIMLAGQGKLDGTSAHLLLSGTLSQPAAIRFEGVLNNILDIGSKVNWTAGLRWDALPWPFASPQNKAPPLFISRAGRLQAGGTKRTYRLELATQLDGAALPSSRWRLSAHGDAQGLTLDKASADVLQGTLSAGGQLDWRQAEPQAQFQVRAEKLDLEPVWLEWPKGLRLDGDLKGGWNGRELAIEQLNARLSGTQTRLSLQGRGDFTGAEPVVKTRLQWQSLRWPLTGKETDFASTEGNLELKGTRHAYEFHLNADLASLYIPAGHWQADGRGDEQGLRFQHVQARAWQGTLLADGYCHWSPLLEWQGTFKGENLNPAQRWADWPGNVGGAVQIRQQWLDSGPTTQIDVHELQGKLRGYPLRLQTRLELQGSRLRLDAIDLQSGSARLSGNLVLADTLSADWNLVAPDLGNLLPQARGSLTGSGRIGGTWQAPAITAKVNGKGLVYRDIRLAQLNAEAFSEGRANGAVSLKVNANELRQGNTLWLQSLQAQGQGRMADQRLTVSLVGPAATLALQVQGGFTAVEPFRAGAWQGTVQQSTATLKEWGNWTLAAPAALKISSRQAQLQRACWQRQPAVRTATGNAQGCAQLDWQPSTGLKLQTELQDWPLSLANPWLPQGWTLSGTLAGNGAGLVRPDGLLRGEAAIRITPGELTTHVEGETQRLRHRGGDLRLTMTDSGLAAQADLKLLEQSTLAATLSLPRFNRLPVNPTQPVEGQLRLNSTELGQLAALLPLLEDPTGRLAIDLDLAGTVAEPSLRGQLRLQNAALAIPDWGLRLQNVDLTAGADGSNTLRLQAGLRSDEGQARLVGTLAFLTLTDWRLNARLDGDRLEIVDNPTARILASPNLTLGVEPGTIDIEGKLLIPSARLTPIVGKLSEGVNNVSADTVIVNPRKPKENNSNGRKWHSTGQINLILGDQVDLKVAGFKSRLGGSVLITQSPQEAIPIGKGELYILNGSYKAYGQHLEIDKGYVIFANQRIDNPTLDIKAVRPIFGDEPVKEVGVYINGTLQSPRLSLFSDPPVEETKILSYLTLGTSIGEEEEEKAPVLSARSKAKPYKVGMYLWPNIYVSYGIDPSRQGNNKIYNVRYEFGRQFWVEGEFEEEGSGIDFSYILER